MLPLSSVSLVTNHISITLFPLVKVVRKEEEYKIIVLVCMNEILKYYMSLLRVLD